MLDALLAGGHRYAFVSNSDNLGATLDCGCWRISWTPARRFDGGSRPHGRRPRKGGHLASRRRLGTWLLREIRDVSEEDLDAFQDTRRHRYFNTNSLWRGSLQLREVRSSRPAACSTYR